MKKIYLASPFFHDEEVKVLETVKNILRKQGHEVFAPNEHQNPQFEFGTLEWRKATFESGLEGIHNADVVVAITNAGNYCDSGTAWEIGYAYAKNIPVVVVNTAETTINLMIADSLHAVLFSYDELEKYDFDTLDKKPYLDYVW